MRTIFKTFCGLFIGAAIGSTLGALLIWLIPEYPDVYTSYSTGECRGIVFKGERLSCDRLPDFPKYNNVWVR